MGAKIAFYVRVSTSDKQDFSYQISALEDVVKKEKVSHGGIDVYKEKVSGYKNEDEREELGKLLKRIKEDKDYYSCVYVTEISRIGRRAIHVRDVLKEFEESKVNLYIASLEMYLLNPDGIRNSYGNIVLSVFIELADAEARMFRERSRHGIKSSIKEGKAGGGKYIPYGFRKCEETKMLIIDEDEANVVQEIFEMYLDGYGVKKISNLLNENNIKTRSALSFADTVVDEAKAKKGSDVLWSDKTVDDILLNPIYKGLRRYWGGKKNKRNGSEPELIEMKGEPLLDPPSLYDDCMEVRKTKTHKNHLTTYTYLLKDRLKCSKCGRNYFAKFKPHSGGDKVYICSSRLKKAGNCGNVGINISLLESAIFNEIISSNSILKHLNSTDEILERTRKSLEYNENLLKVTQSEIDVLDRDIISATELQIKANSYGNLKLVDRYSASISSKEKELESKKKYLKTIKRNISKTQKALIKQSNIQTTAQQLKEYKNDRVKLRMVFLQIINKVQIHSINKDTALVDIFISLDGILLPETLKLFLDLKGIRKKQKSYSYIPIVNMDKNIEYNNYVMTSSIEEIKETYFKIKDNLGLLGDIDNIYISKKNILEIPIDLKSENNY